MRGPIASGDLVGDQAISSEVIGNPQQRLGKAHENDAFVRRQIITTQKGIESGTIRLRTTNPFNQSSRAASDAITSGVIDPRCIQ